MCGSLLRSAFLPVRHLLLLFHGAAFPAFFVAVCLASSSLQAQPDLTMKAFFEAAVRGEMQIVKTMLEADPSLISARDQFGFQIFHIVATEEHYDEILFLVKKGADVNATHSEGVTPLFVASHPESVNILVHAGANLEAKDNRKKPLSFHGPRKKAARICWFFRRERWIHYLFTLLVC
jgi:Ankyrin repeats (3 copies)